MPHKWYHGKTGTVWNVTKRAIGVEINKRVRVDCRRGIGSRNVARLGKLAEWGLHRGGLGFVYESLQPGRRWAPCVKHNFSSV